LPAPPLPPSAGGPPPAAVPTQQARLFDLADGASPQVARINAILYGNSGVGKTSLATALRWDTERWGSADDYREDAKYAAYVAWDAGSESLLSVRPEDRRHLAVITPRPGKDGRMNPYKAGMEIADADWKALLPDVKTLIWDGGTRFAEQILRGVANTGATVSPRKKADGEYDRLFLGTQGDSDFMALPIIPDYGMAQHAVMQWSEMLRRQPLNVICICTSDYYKPDGAAPEDTVGGPGLVGVKIIPKFMKDWDNVFRISIEPETVNIAPAGQAPKWERRSSRTLWTEKNGVWEAKIRKPPSANNPLARVVLTPNPTEFWELFDASGMGAKDGH
jgi:hypothetical protein